MSAEHPAASRQVERDVVTVRAQLDYPKRKHADYIAALKALDRLARKAHEADALIAQHELCGSAGTATVGGTRFVYTRSGGAA